MSHATRANNSVPLQSPPLHETDRPRRSLPLIACVLLIALFASTAWLASLHESATTDEPVSLLTSWACTYPHDFRSDTENPPLWKYYVGVGIDKDDFRSYLQSPQWKRLLTDSREQGTLASEALYSTPGLDANSLLRGERARMILFGAALAGMIAWWSWRIAGPAAAVVATAFFCLDPNFLAHAPLVKNDVPVALAFLWVMAMAWLVGERATFLRLTLMAVAMGAALMTKFSGVLAVPVLGILLMLRSLMPSPWPVGRWNLQSRGRRVAAAAGIFLCSLLFTWGLIWACYDFRFAPTRDPAESFDFQAALQTCAAHDCLARSADPFNVPAQAVQDFVRNWKPPAFINLLLAANAHHLLPQSFLRGLIGEYAWILGRVSFLCGKSSVTGWWYYFPLAMTFKTPLATLSGLGIAAIFMVIQYRPLSIPNRWTLAVTAIPPLLFLAYAMTSRVDVGIRHVFPVYPFLFIFLGIAASVAYRRFGKTAAGVAAILLVVLAAETYSVFPNYIPFFNLATGGARGGLRLLSESNIDWGQDLPQLAQWQRQNPGHQMYLCYWGSAHPRYYGLHYLNMAASDAPPDEIVPARQPPVYVFSAVALTQPSFRARYKMLLDSLQKREPLSVLDGSLYIYAGTP